MCCINAKKSKHPPLQVNDVIVSLNGITMSEVMGGKAAWDKLIDAFWYTDRNIVMLRGRRSAGNHTHL